MRLSIAPWLALSSTLLADSALAFPSPADQNPLHPPAAPSTPWPAKPQWRKLSNFLIESVWPQRKEYCQKAPKSPSPDLARNAPPASLLARYGGDVVLRFNISSTDDAQSLAVAADTLLLDIWEFSHDWVDVRLSMDIVAPLLGLLPASLQNAHTPLLRERDLAQAIYETYPASRQAQDQSLFSGHVSSPFTLRTPSLSLKPRDDPEGNAFFADYQPLSVIEPWIRLMSSLFTTHVRRVVVGKSHQGRDIIGLRVGVHPTNSDKPQPKRKTILIMGGLHAREWVSTSTVNYIAYSLITAYGKTPAITTLLETFDFVLLPTVNPDGYAYTWETDRLWRKNRQQTSFRFCQGIDLDRNFDYEWDGLTTTADNPCSESYAGSTPFEAVESRALADWAKNESEHNNVEWVGLLDLHSYSQAILYPYSFSCSIEPPGLENLEELAFGLQKAIRVSHGHNYEAMAACEGNFAVSKSGASKKNLFSRMEAAGGSALDYFHHDLGVRYSYQIKLRDRGTYGFLLPRGEIVPTGKEIYDAVLYFAEFLRGVYEIDSINDMDVKDESMMKSESEDGSAEVEPESTTEDAVQIPETSDVDEEAAEDSLRQDLRR
ncbi:Hypothetical protein R9X50_00601200 [Acrodontium crateriforme]|uniref:Inactive metallocarboxypeptidase ECM14 n=1 Tax=Acrodontium crateriforme TaxID=150365 RepID=A0AAQ3MD05_9PEZI|nr:Hypothetical protein R9X50_00601200 [Acrodontium crateriforme]